jgi:superfamily II DNA or RNA helicase
MDIEEKYEVGWVLESEKINIRVVSGSSKHSDVIDIKNTDDVVIATLQSIQRAYSNPTKSEKILDFLKSSNGKIFVVFDEAHHAPAPSFRKMLIGDESDSKVPKSIRELFPECIY